MSKVIESFKTNNTNYQNDINQYTTLVYTDNVVVTTADLIFTVENNPRSYNRRTQKVELIPYKFFEGDLDKHRFNSMRNILSFIGSSLYFLSQLNKKNFHHGDIKPPNVLFKTGVSENIYCMGDYGSIDINPSAFSPLYMHPCLLFEKNLGFFYQIKDHLQISYINFVKNLKLRNGEIYDNLNKLYTELNHTTLSERIKSNTLSVSNTLREYESECRVYSDQLVQMKNQKETATPVSEDSSDYENTFGFDISLTLVIKCTMIMMLTVISLCGFFSCQTDLFTCTTSIFPTISDIMADPPLNKLYSIILTIFSCTK
jgi:hypothetical protein